MIKKALVLFSGGLDSRVTAKYLEELGFLVHLCFIKLPFNSCGNISNVLDFAKENNFELHVVDVTSGKLFEEYFNLIKKPKYGRGIALNPCRDCKIFMFKEGYKIFEKIKGDVFATGEVLGQRPMSQMKSSLMLDEEKAGLSGKILRPLSGKLLPETIYEKSKLIDRSKLLDIFGRRRERQLAFAKNYGINFPNPAGGCILCEQSCGAKLKFLLNYGTLNLDEFSILFSVLNKGRMFHNSGLLILGRNEIENNLLEEVGKNLGWNIEKNIHVAGPTVIYEKKEDKDFALQLWNAYSSKNLELRSKFEKIKI